MANMRRKTSSNWKARAVEESVLLNAGFLVLQIFSYPAAIILRFNKHQIPSQTKVLSMQLAAAIGENKRLTLTISFWVFFESSTATI